MHDVSIILPYYRNPGVWQLQLERFRSFPADLRAHIEVLLIDDGSPKNPATPPEVPIEGMTLRMFRIEVDVRWNWIAARNIGQKHASSVWRLFTDIDHLLPEATARRIVEGKLDARNIYRFSRVNYPKGDEYKPHPNTWMLTGDMMESVGGYDERFSGYYGTDGMFRDRCSDAAAAAGGKVVMLKQPMERVDREVLKDASTTTYGRKEEQDKEAVPRIRAEIAASGDLRPHRLTFPYQQIFP